MSRDPIEPTNISDIDDLTNDDALEIIGHLIDLAYVENSSTGTTRAFAFIDALDHNDRQLTPAQSVLLQYFRANAWENRLHETGKIHSWDWELPELQNQILALRRAVSHDGFGDLPHIRQCQILTNLASKLNSAGRFIEAVEVWDRALAMNEFFAMALGNRGLGLKSYANAVYDPGHANILGSAAHDAFGAASAETAQFDSEENKYLRDSFASAQVEISQIIDVSAARDLLGTSFNMGRSKAERAYREWTLSNRLFINPLNDLGTFEIAARDVLTLPSITVALSSASASPPPAIGLFNQMKQEFVSARYLFFDGILIDKTHFSDRGVLLYNTLDYPSYALGVEQMRAAYRVTYSIFDKIAYLLNDYFQVGWPANKVSFRNVWYEPKGPSPKPLRPLFVDRANWPLRGLFWLSKDLFDSKFRESTEPEAEALADIRNHLEHKYLQIHESWRPTALSEDKGKTKSGLAYHISRDEFEAKTLRVLKLARAALIYLSLAVHCEERNRNHDKTDKFVAPLPLDTWDDEWKV